MGMEIDFLAVGDVSRSGDAIALRYGNLHGPRSEQTIVVIDGGFSETGHALASHLKTHFGTDHVDFAFLTHPDGDHACGLVTLLDLVNVDTLIMHRPWDHAADICSMFKDGRITDESLEIRIRKSLNAAHELEVAARKKNIKIVEPFAGLRSQDGVMQVLGPTKEFYQSLLPQYRRTPEAKAIERGFFEKAVDAVKWVAEALDIETLTDEGETSAENNSSAVILFSIDGRRYLFTGDAGIPALHEVVGYAGTQGIDLTTLRFLDVPHHGSRRNVGPSILNQIKAETAFISASKNGEPKHPSKKVINALKRRGSKVYTTQGKGVQHGYNAPDRLGWSTATEVPFFEFVEE